MTCAKAYLKEPVALFGGLKSSLDLDQRQVEALLTGELSHITVVNEKDEDIAHNISVFVLVGVDQDVDRSDTADIRSDAIKGKTGYKY